MKNEMQATLLTTVNAPYQKQLDASGLAAALKEGNLALGQVSSFFTETAVETQKAFAKKYGIAPDVLSDIATTFKDWSGQSVPLIG